MPGNSEAKTTVAETKYQLTNTTTVYWPPGDAGRNIYSAWLTLITALVRCFNNDRALHAVLLNKT